MVKLWLNVILWLDVLCGSGASSALHPSFNYPHETVGKMSAGNKRPDGSFPRGDRQLGIAEMKSIKTAARRFSIIQMEINLI